jgi:hypothetical protein
MMARRGHINAFIKSPLVLPRVRALLGEYLSSRVKA